MTKPTDLERRDRRTFLRGIAGAGAATTALVMGAGGAGNAAEAEDGREEPAAERKGYHVTPHIKTYYDKAQF